jgi:hypothetical protein
VVWKEIPILINSMVTKYKINEAFSGDNQEEYDENQRIGVPLCSSVRCHAWPAL